MRRRKFIQWLGAAVAALAIDPVIGGQPVWGTKPPTLKIDDESWCSPGRTFTWDKSRSVWFESESSYVWAPYIPVHKQPADWMVAAVPNKKIRARYSAGGVNRDYYGTLTIKAENS